MSKQRMINTRFWDDSYISNLDPIEKLLFIYLLTNPLTNILGIYEIEIRRIAYDTGIDKEMILKILSRFEADQKCFFAEGHIVMINFLKHQNVENPKMKAGIERSYDELPHKAKVAISDKLKGMDRVSIGYLYPITLNLTKLNLTKLNYIEPEKPEETEIIEAVSSYKPKKLFADSEHSDFQTFETHFTNHPDFNNYDASHYFAQLRDWSASKNQTSADWISTVYSWIRRDVLSGKEVKKQQRKESFDERAARLLKEEKEFYQTEKVK